MRTVFLDIETGSANDLYTYGPGFCRLAGWAIDDAPVQLTTNMDELCDVVRSADRVVAHNGLTFDLAALERWHGLDVGKMVEQGQVRDTLLLARHNDPPFSGHVDARRYNLDAIGQRLIGDGKVSEAGESALKKLAKEFGGYDQIPVDHEQYREYLVQDVELLRRVFAYLRCDAYALREHRVMYRLNHISRHGFRVDVAEAKRRLAAQAERIETAKQKLATSYGLPTSGKAPQRTKAGVTALERAFADCGIEPPRTPKGALATGKQALADLLDEHPENTALSELVGVLGSLNGERSVIQTVLDHTGPDDRVRPSVDARQTTGRISVTNPGLTVMGKRDRGNVLERSLLLPDPGDVLIAFDLSQVDARAIAAHCQDEGYIAAFKPGLDYHSEMAAELFNGDRSRRDDAKPVTHATTYGMGAKGLATEAGIGRTEAELLLSKLDRRFPRLARFKQSSRQEAERRHLLFNAFGRPMRIERGREYTQAPAALGQGTARDLMMEGILRLPDWLVSCLRAIVHDEVVLSVPEGRANDAETEVLSALQFSFRITADAEPVQILADKSERGRDWADCYRAEKHKWPEVARDHRELPSCDDDGCTYTHKFHSRALATSADANDDLHKETP